MNSTLTNLYDYSSYCQVCIYAWSHSHHRYKLLDVCLYDGYLLYKIDAT